MLFYAYDILLHEGYTYAADAFEFSVGWANTDLLIQRDVSKVVNAHTVIHHMDYAEFSHS
jgi:hypothetical protein